MVNLDKIGFDINYSSDIRKELLEIEKSLTYYNPNSHFAQSDHWDGSVKYYNKSKRTFSFGHLSTVLNNLIKKNIDFEIFNVDFEIFKPKTTYTSTLHQHQTASLHSFFQTKYGIIKVPTRGGKTYIASEAIRLVIHSKKQYKVLFIVDSQLLFNQAIKDIAAFLKIQEQEIGRIKEEIFDIRQITVAMIQTIQSINNGLKRIKKTKRKKGEEEPIIIPLSEIKEKKKQKRIQIKKLDLFLENVNFLIVDECHEYSSQDRIKIIKKVSNGEFYMFLSATPFKSENLLANISIKGICGDIIYEIPEQELKKRGVLALDKILLIKINHLDNPNINFNRLNGFLDHVDKVIVANQQRNQIIINICEICRKLELKTLGLFSYKRHGYNISKITGDPFITGVNDLDDREFVKKAFLDKRGGVLLASNIFNKGITLPDVQVMINIGGGLEQSGIIQKKGRVLGTTAVKKKALIVDFIDESQYFSKHSLSRIEVYEKSVGMENIMVVEAEDDEMYPLIREFIKEWFKL